MLLPGRCCIEYLNRHLWADLQILSQGINVSDFLSLEMNNVHLIEIQTSLKSESMKNVLFFVFVVMLSLNAAAQGPIAHWDMNGSAADVSGGGHNGHAVNVTPAAGSDGIMGHGYYFNCLSALGEWFFRGYYVVERHWSCYHCLLNHPIE